MRTKTWFWHIITLGLIISLYSCTNGESVKISGRFIGSESHTVILERALPSSVVVIDSTKTDSKGNYKFSLTPPNAETTLYHIKINGEIIPLFLSPGERVDISSFYANPQLYAIQGSKESSLLKEINDIFNNGIIKLDSIANMCSFNDKRIDKRKAMSEYTKIYYGIKTQQVEFIVRNTSSLASIYALQLRLPGDDILFNDDNDFAYYVMVADSIEKYHPKSPYLTMLRKRIDSDMAQKLFLEEVEKSFKNPSSFPDINLPDIYGKNHKLSDNIGKVIIIDFWSSASGEAAINNAEYKELFEEFSQSGLVIYQVDINKTKHEWVNAVVDQRLPWITVNDLLGVKSPAMMNYNISKIPSNFIINAEGDIVAKDLYGDKLCKEIAKLIRDIK